MEHVVTLTLWGYVAVVAAVVLVAGDIDASLKRVLFLQAADHCCRRGTAGKTYDCSYKEMQEWSSRPAIGGG